MGRAIKALSAALISTNQGLTLSSVGSVRDPSENLIDGVSLQDLKPIFAKTMEMNLEENFAWPTRRLSSQ